MPQHIAFDRGIDDHPLTLKFQQQLANGKGRVDLSLTDVRCEGCADVALAVQDFPDLTTLDLSCNSVLLPGSQVIAAALRVLGCSLTSLDLSANHIGDAGAFACCEALKENNTLTHLDLHSCGIHDPGAEYFAELLTSNHTLRSLNLRANYIGDDGALVLAEALPENEGLYELNLHCNDFSRTGGEALLQVLREHKTIKSFGQAGAGLEQACVIN
eukprot:TRINITY_DN7450_c0_g1_i2.p1 TRINITY_DN7450_c0_g1~~TRINITY_DN7450_c0_g1_i2.p1  ORF type:complete len:215 (+),score=52.50 TRINITY_DN7450_c0_g1_i2:183-827(+)